jgi:hypothetical protein
MNGLLASAGLVDVAFSQALGALVIVGVGTASGVCGVLYGLLSPSANRGVCIILGLVGLTTVVAYAGWFRIVNGVGSWEHAARHPIFHAVLIGSPLCSNLCALAIAWLRRRQHHGAA